MKNMKFGDLIKQVIKFCVVGASNTVIQLGVYYLIIFIFNIQEENIAGIVIAYTIGFIISVINSFFWNTKFVFKEKEEKSRVKSFVKMFLSYGFTCIISNLLNVFFITVIGLSKIIAPIIGLAITIPVNFVLNKLWAFKDKSI